MELKLNIKIGYLCIKDKKIQFINNQDLNTTENEYKEFQSVISTPKKLNRDRSADYSTGKYHPKVRQKYDTEFKKFTGSVKFPLIT